MREKLQPQLVEVDPHLIKFNPANPRKHRGSAYFRLKKSITDIGFVQMPTVRVLAGGFYECIDGEGRVRIAQETHVPTIKVISLDIVDDPKALTMLQAANAIRDFNLLAEYKGLANLHRQGLTIPSLAEKFGVHLSLVTDMVAIGYFPDELFNLILEDMARSEEQASRWTPTLLHELLLLRQEHPGQDGRSVEHGQSVRLDALYDYPEVRRAVEKVVRGEIVNVAQMGKYVAQRRLELYQERFNQELHRQVEAEIVRAKQTLEESYRQHTQAVQEQTARDYEQQVESFRQKLMDLEKRHQVIVKEVAKRPEIVAQREEELRKQVAQTQAERQSLLERQQHMQAEASQLERQLREDMKRQLETEREQQQTRLEQEYTRTKANLETYYAQKDQERQINAQNDMHKRVAYAVQLLAEAQQSMLHLISPGMIQGMAWLQDIEITGLLSQMRTLRETLERAEEKLLHGSIVASSGMERRTSDGSSTQRH